MGGATRSRILFQILLASARKSIQITTPYFLPDHSLTDQLIRAVRRQVKVQILVPGKKSDLWLTRDSSRVAYGRLLKAGMSIYEYQPSMIHAKVLLIDGIWGVVGSTNFDNRSFGLNDEVNLAAFDEAYNATNGEHMLRLFTGPEGSGYHPVLIALDPCSETTENLLAVGNRIATAFERMADAMTGKKAE